MPMLTSHPTTALLLLLLLLSTHAQPQPDTLDTILYATKLIRATTQLDQGANLLSTLLSTANATNRPLLQNNLAAAILLLDSNHPLRQRHDPLQLLHSSSTTAPWCSAATKNLRWALATLPPHERLHHDQLATTVELDSWRHAVFELVHEDALPHIDPVIAQAMKDDGQTRYLNWCGDTHHPTCQSILGDPIQLQHRPGSSSMHSIATNAKDKQCVWYPTAWINLFDDAAVPFHQHLCHPRTSTSGPRLTDSNYLDLLFRSLTGYLFRKTPHSVPITPTNVKNRSFTWSLSYGSMFGESKFLATGGGENDRGGGVDDIALTGIQAGSLVMLDFFIQDIVKLNILGDFVECGVWRGGSSMAMTASLRERDPTNVHNRRVHLFDSFKGVPETSNQTPDIDEVKGWVPRRYAASLKSVRQNFYRFGLLDPGMVRFVKGDFSQTMLGAAPRTNALLPDRISLLRIDVDSYEGTKTVLATMYALVEKGGYVVVDDGHLKGCATAIHEFRQGLVREGKVLTPLRLTPIDHVNTCGLDQGRRAVGVNELLKGGDVDVTFRCGPQVVYWRKE